MSIATQRSKHEQLARSNPRELVALEASGEGVDPVVWALAVAADPELRKAMPKHKKTQAFYEALVDVDPSLLHKVVPDVHRTEAMVEKYNAATRPRLGDWAKGDGGAVGRVLEVSGRRVRLVLADETTSRWHKTCTRATAEEEKLARAVSHLTQLQREANAHRAELERCKLAAQHADDEAKRAMRNAHVANNASREATFKALEAHVAVANGNAKMKAHAAAVRAAQEAVDVADAERSAAAEEPVDDAAPSSFEADLATLGLQWDNPEHTRLVARAAPLNGDVLHRLLDAHGFDLMEVRLPKEGGRLLRFERSLHGQRQLFCTVEPPTDPPTLPEHFQSWHSPVRHAPLVGNSAQRGAAQHEEVSLLSDDEEAGAPNKKRRVVPPEESSSDEDDDIPPRPRAGVPEELSDEDVCEKRGAASSPREESSDSEEDVQPKKRSAPRPLRAYATRREGQRQASDDHMAELSGAGELLTKLFQLAHDPGATEAERERAKAKLAKKLTDEDHEVLTAMMKKKNEAQSEPGLVKILILKDGQPIQQRQDWMIQLANGVAKHFFVDSYTQTRYANPKTIHMCFIGERDATEAAADSYMTLFDWICNNAPGRNVTSAKSFAQGFADEYHKICKQMYKTAQEAATAQRTTALAIRSTLIEQAKKKYGVKLRMTGGLSGSRADAAAYAAGQRAATGQANQAIKRRALPY